ncbi:MAG: urea ABC transporter substrate-binding protein [Emcibacter sp.]|nr:urea ABC transporter substrate-binding protein [Emcibacter sp.]
MNIKTRYSRILISIVLLLLISAMVLFTQNKNWSKGKPIRIGILHSLSGTMAKSEKPLVDILLMGIDEINEKGGVLGRKLEAVIHDSKSDNIVAALEAEKMIRDEKVDVIFGCWTSSCRKAVKPIVEKYNHLSFYPVQYEGLEHSNNIVYTGAVPNQQIIPGTIWAIDNLGPRIYLVGSDYIFPRTANFIIRDIAKIKNAKIVAERYLPLGSDGFDVIMSEIKELRPDIILNTINGDSNKAFFLEKHLAGLDDIPMMSFSISETELSKIPEAQHNTHYAVWNYFQSIDNQVNRDFINRIRKRFGSNQIVGDPMEASYIGLNLWAQATESIKTTDPSLVYRSLNEQSIMAPQGMVSIDKNNHHLNKKSYVGRANKEGLFDIIWETKYRVKPVPFPTYRNKKEWDVILKNISRGGQDEAPQ